MVVRLEALEGQFLSLETLMATLRGADNRCITDQWIMDTWVGNQVGLELVQINIESTIETQRTRDRANNLGNETVKVLKRRTWNIEVTSTYVIDGFVIDKECTIAVFDGGVGGENCVVRLDNGGGNSGSRIDGKLEFTLLAVISGEAFKQE